nr:unnamed protein product [Callosobruchus chinensis]
MDLTIEFRKLLVEEYFSKSMDTFNNRLKQAMNVESPEVREIHHEYSSFKDSLMQVMQHFKTIVVNMEQHIDTVEIEMWKSIILIHGIYESENESLDNSVKHVLSTMKINNLSDNAVEESHRFGLPRPGNKKPRPIIVKFAKYQHKQTVWNAKKNLKNTSIMITEFLTKNQLVIYNEAKKLFGNQKCWTTNGQIRVMLPDGKKTSITSLSQLEGYKRAPGSQYQFSASGYSTRSKNK